MDLVESFSTPPMCLPTPEPTRQVVLGLEVVFPSYTSDTILVIAENKPSCSRAKPSLDIEKEIYGIKETLEKIKEPSRIIQERL